jgi:flagellar hook-basal body complex protein FliE
MATPSAAAAAYSSLSSLLNAGKGTAGAGKVADASGPSFGALVKEAMGSVLDAGQRADSQTMAMAQGKANILDVVTAVSETVVAVSTLVSVRDRVIQSYEDIMRMPI